MHKGGQTPGRRAERSWVKGVEGVEEVLWAYALIPQEITWVLEFPAVPELEREGRGGCSTRRVHNCAAPSLCRDGMMKFCGRWGFVVNGMKEWLKAAHSLFDLGLSLSFGKMSLSSQKQALFSQSVADGKAYGISESSLTREKDRRVQFLKGE